MIPNPNAITQPIGQEFLILSPDFSETVIETCCYDALEACLSVKARSPWNFLPYWGGWHVYSKNDAELSYQGTVQQILGAQ